MPWHPRLGILAFGALLVAGFAGSAKALPITFDEFALGTVITNQYASEGVLFAAVTFNAPVLSQNTAMPDAPILRPDGGPSTFAGDFDIIFTTAVTMVTFDSGFWDEIGTAQIDLYDTFNNLILSATNTVIGVETMTFSGLGNISRIYFNSVGDPAGGDIDNLSFQPIPEPSGVLLFSVGMLVVGRALRQRAA